MNLPNEDDDDISTYLVYFLRNHFVSLTYQAIL
jgi:hypothetical protein